MITHIAFCSILLVTVSAQFTETTTTSVTEILTTSEPFSASSSAPSNGSCGGHFTGEYGLITSPNFPYNYPDRQDCGWLITAPALHTVNLTFLSFNFEGSLGCVYDYVAVYDGSNTSSRTYLKHCGPLLPLYLSYKSTSNQMYVRMSTDASVSGKGFKAMYHAQRSDCGGELFGPTGVLTSPNYPNNYPDNTNCTWLITVPTEHLVYFSFLDLSLEYVATCTYDSISLYDGTDGSSPLLVKKCGTLSSSAVSYQSSSNAMYVHMSTDSSVTDRGFKARYTMTSTTNCGGKLTEETGILTSPNYPNNYPNDVSCTWLITAPESHWVNLTFVDFDIESSFNCTQDYVVVYNGSNDVPIAKLCGNQLPISYESPSRLMSVRMFTDGSGTGKGFKAMYTMKRCGGELTGETGFLTSPRYPSSYPSSSDCGWLITVPDSETVYLIFLDFDIHNISHLCTYNYVALYDGANSSSPLIARQCGSSLPIPVTYQSSSNQMYVRMKIQYYLQGKGFRARYSVNSSNCGGVLTEETGFLTSPNYPNSYPPYSSCIWLITAPELHWVNLTFLDFDMGNSTSCSDNFVAIYNGSSALYILIANLCGTQLPSPVSYLSTSSNMYVHMFASGSGIAKGFKAMYTMESCGSELSGESGLFSSTNYPNNYSPSSDCGWLITVPDSQTVYITFLDFDIPPASSYCSYSYVALYDGANSSSPLIARKCGSLLQSPVTYQSSSNQMYVRMKIQYYLQGKGFRARYSVNSSNCGGVLTEETGFLTSPNYPDSYPPYSACSWLITAPESHWVNLTFLDFDMGNSTSCADDFVTVYNGSTALSTVIANLCGTQLPSPVYLSPSINMYVQMIADGSGTATGFKAMYTIQGCGDQLSGETGLLTSPNYPGNYPNSRDCRWLITVPAPGIVHLTFLDFDLESESDCRYDFVSLHDGANVSSPLLMKKCGRSITTFDSYQSSSNQMYVRMYTDYIVTRKGFKARYSVNSSNCGGVLTEETGFFTSPNYPNSYPPYTSCSWLITAPESHWVNLTFLDFDMGNSTNCSDDFVAIYNGSSALSIPIANLCGTQLPSPVSYLSTSSNMYVHMFALGSGTATGFKAMYTMESCGSELSGETGLFSSTNYPNNYPPSSDCGWLITVPDSQTVYITFLDFDIPPASPNCSYSYVALYDGANSSSPLIARKCGSLLQSLATFQSSSNHMYVRMKIQYYLQGKGFRARYSVNNSDSFNHTCGGEQFEETGFLLSPNYPNNYPSDTSCRWLLTAPASQTVYLTFLDFDIENLDNCTDGYVAAYDGQSTLTPLIVKHCGTMLPTPASYESSNNTMYVHMFAYGLEGTGSGFKAMYYFKSCGDQLSGETGLLTSPNYPGNYPNSRDCRWLITVPAPGIVHLTFLDFDLESESDCRYDFVSLYDGASVSSPLLMKKCGRSITTFDSYQSSSNQMYVRMYTDSSVTRKGFKARYSVNSSNCGGVLTEETGFLTSPNYPNRYPPYISCSWLITAPESHWVNLTFLDFDMGNSTNCSDYFVAIYNGSSALSIPIANLCGTQLPSPVSYLSTSSNMYVHMFALGSGTATGFKAMYTMESCGSELSGESGLFTSTNYPNNFSPSRNCGWLITVPDSQTVHITFLDFDIPPASSYCSYSYVALYDGANSSSPLIARKCGSLLQSPVTYQSSSNQMYVRMKIQYYLQGNGFRAWYSVNISNCGGVLTEETGFLTSPNYPNSYPPYSSCSWMITAPESHWVNLTFLDFDMGNSTSCADDYVTVYNGSSALSTVIANLCGTQLPSPVSYLSSSINMYVQMIADGSGTATGFKAMYTMEGCGTELSGETGLFSSTNYPNNYPPSSDCGWLITVPDSETVYLTFLDFEIHSASSYCSYSYVALYDGANSSSRLIANLCGSLLQSPVTYQSSSNHIYVRMKIQYYHQGKGFRARYSVNNSDSFNHTCGGEQFEETGFLLSPNYPNNYPSDTSCRWLLTAPASQTVYLTFLDFDIDNLDNCTDGYVAAFDGQSTLTPLIVKHCGTMLPTPASYESSNNTMYVHMFAYGLEGTGSGFKAMYYFKSCGDQLSGETGLLTSPNYPGNYPNSKDCRWLITVPAPGIVHLTFLDFDLESESDCRYDFVSLYDGASVSSPLLMKKCGRSITTFDSYQSSSNQMYVRMYTDSSVTRKGFKARYSVNSSNCGGVLTEETGFLTSPNYPNRYPPYISCSWLITAPESHWVNLTFLDFDMGNSTNCSDYFVAIYNGSSALSIPIANLCGTQLPSPVSYLSTSSNMYVHMFALGSGTAIGFKAMYTMESCGGELSGETGLFSSTNYPNNYPTSSDCGWLITVPDSQTVYITFLDFDIPPALSYCWYSYVALYDGANSSSPLIARKCGSLLQSLATFQSSSNHMYVRMKIQYYLQGKGFRARYSVNSSNCGGVLTAETGFLTSPNYPNNYPPYTSCSWLITAPESHWVNLTFLDFDMENSTSCTNDYVTVYNGSSAFSTVIANPCGTQLPRPVSYLSSSINMYVQMVTDGSGTATGFKAMYTMEGCGTELSGETGLFSSTNYPNNYPPSSDCGWLITVPDSETVYLTFLDFEIHSTSSYCSNSSVALYDGANSSSRRIANLCGSLLPSPVTYQSSSNHMYVRMKIQYYHQGKGFRARYSVNNSDSFNQTCGGEQFEETGFLLSPNYPNNYPSDSSCRWLLTAPASQTVYLTFLDFDIENLDNCTDGYVAAYDGQSTLTPLIVKHCGTMLPTPASYESSNNTMYVHMFAYGLEGTGSGFKAMYYFKNCGDQLSGETGLLTSPNYPGNYPNSKDCRWLITVPAPGIVHLTFLDFDLESKSDCGYDFVSLYDGASVSSPLLMKKCGRSITTFDSYQSSSNQMYVRMYTDHIVARKGFKARYSVNSSYCGGYLTDETGYLTSPNYPNTYPHDISCTWLIASPESHWVNITFLDFDFGTSENCSDNYVAVYDGSSASSTVIANLCGSQMPSPVTYLSTSSYMFVHMFSVGSETGRGFHAMYLLESCGSELSGETGLLVSPNYPRNYLPSMDCRWLITVPDSETVYLTFEDFEVHTISTSCMNDYVAVYDGVNTSSPLITKECGSLLPSPVTYQSSSNQMLVRMKTGNYVTGKGFRARYSVNSSDSLNQTCGGEIFDETGFIASPSYPNNYPRDRSCRWLITVPVSHTVYLTFLDFDIDDSDNCSNGYVAVYNGINALAPLIVKHCGRLLPITASYQSTSNQIYVHLFASESGTGRGFKVMYSLTNCGETYRDFSGVIIGKIFPEPFYHNPDCHWLITVGSGRSVIFNFTDFAVGESYVDLCPNDSVVIYDGDSVQSMEMMRHCGSSLPSDNFYTSTTNHLFIRMRTSRSTVGTGFTAEYRSSGLLCGRRGRRTSSSRIHGGYLATRYDAPWQVSLYEVSRTNSSRFICGGTILSESWILSAAHCFDGYDVASYNVTLGHIRRNAYDQGQQSFIVSSITKHEQYNDVTYDYDIAVVKVKPFQGNLIQLSEYVEPACLPSFSSSYTSGKVCYISGWGETESGNTYDLMGTNVTLVDTQICNRPISYDGKITPRMFCAGSEGIDTCQGDSGGPLVCSEDGQYTIYGVTSWGYGCGLQNFPGVYTNVKYLLNWVKEKTEI